MYRITFFLNIKSIVLCIMKLFRLILLSLIISLIVSKPVLSYKLNLAFTDEDNNLTNLSIYQGNFLLVDAFATWCDSCREEMFHLQRLYDEVGDQLQMLSLSTDPEDTISMINEFKDEFQAPWDFGSDHDSQFLHSYPFITYPAAYLFNLDGKLVRTWTGITTTSKFLNDLSEFIDVPDNNYADEELDMFVDNILSNPLFIITGSLILILILYNTFQKIRILSNKEKSIKN